MIRITEWKVDLVNPLKKIDFLRSFFRFMFEKKTASRPIPLFKELCPENQYDEEEFLSIWSERKDFSLLNESSISFVLLWLKNLFEWDVVVSIVDDESVAIDVDLDGDNDDDEEEDENVNDPVDVLIFK